MILVLLMYMFFATTFVFGKMALAYSEPMFFIGIRMIVAGVLLLAYQYLRCPKELTYDKKLWWLYLHIILFHIFAAFTLEFWALKYVAASKACLIYNLSPFVTALYAYILTNERLTIKKWVGLGIGFIGALPILLSQSYMEAGAGTLLRISLPEIALLGAVASSAYGWLTMKKLMQANQSFVTVNGIGMLGGGMLAMISTLCLEGKPHLSMPAVKNSLDILVERAWGATCAPYLLFGLYTIIMIVIANIICYNMYGYCLARFSPTLLSFAGFTTPLFAALFDWLFIGEAISWAFAFSAMLTFWGLYIFYSAEIENL